VVYLACSAPEELVKLSPLWSRSQSGASTGRARAAKWRTAFAPVGFLTSCSVEQLLTETRNVVSVSCPRMTFVNLQEGS